MPQCSKCGTLVVKTIIDKEKEYCLDCYNKHYNKHLKKEIKRYGWTICAYDIMHKKFWLTFDSTAEHSDQFQFRNVGWQYRFVWLTRDLANDRLKILRYNNVNRLVLVRIRRRVIKKKKAKQ